ncbi:MAG: hypothetical protein M3421_06700, partial [Bacteroidota bacterium]|jgi:hypothetical protein|nr:hypothetical protein [Bacteroidota bacterium]
MANSAQYSGITPEIFNKMKNQLSNVGIDMEGNSGQIAEKGISANYIYNPESKSLAINDVKVGFPANMMYNSETILEKISETVESSGGQRIA